MCNLIIWVRVVLLEGSSVNAADITDVDQLTIMPWIKQYREQGICRPHDARRSGKQKAEQRTWQDSQDGRI